MKQKLLIIALLALATLPATAQKKWSYHLDGGGTINIGNVNNISLSQGGGADRNDSILSFSGNYKYIYGEQEKIMNNRELNASVQFDLWQYDMFSPFVAATELINRFKGYDNKLSLLAGAKYRIYTLPGVCDYSVSAAYVMDFVDYYEETSLADMVQRLSFRAKIKQKIGKMVSFNHTTFYMPSIVSDRDFCDDYIITSVSRLGADIYKNVNLGVVFTYEYRSLVPDNVKREDIRTELSLRVNF